MIVRGYGVELHLLSEEDLELVRVKRNSDFIRDRMEYREEITPEMQQQWFRTINNAHNNYYVIVYQNEKVGLISGNQVDWEKRETGNGGLFIWEEKFRDSLVPIAASLLLTDLTFLIGLERVRIKVMRNNTRAVTYNRLLGFELLEGQEHNESQLYELTKERYEARTGKLKQTLHRQYGPEIITTVTNPEQPFCRKLISIYNQLPEDRKVHFKLQVQ